jgi:hypothetical protein
MSRASGQLGSGALGSFQLGAAGPLGAQQARINTFTASSYGPVVPGTSITLTWTTSFATSASISGIGAVAVNGSTVVNPAVTTTYVLAVTDGVNPPQALSITIIVTNAAVFVRGSLGGPSLNNVVSCHMQVDLGDLVVVGVASGIQSGSDDLTVTDNLGNIYSVAIQGNQLPPDSATAEDAQIAYTIVTHAGSATILATCTAVHTLCIVAAEYSIPPGMELDQTAHTIGGITVSSPNRAVGTAPVNYANSLLITFARQGGYCIGYSSLDGDNKRLEITSCDLFQTTGCALFDRVLAGPGIRNSSVEFSPINVGLPDSCGIGTCQPGPFYGFGGFNNCLVAVFSAPLVRAASLDHQAAVRPGLSSTISGYAGQPDVEVSLGYIPQIGSLVLVGCAAGWTGSGPVPGFTPTDAYGNSYTLLVQYNNINFESNAMFYTVVAHVPATGVFKVNVNISTPNHWKSITLAEHDINSLNPAQIQAVVQVAGTVGSGQVLLSTAAVTVAAQSLIAGFGAAERLTGTPTPWVQAGGFAIDTSWDTGQVDGSPLANAARQGTGDWFHQTVQAGTYTGQTITDGNGTDAVGSTGIIIIAVPAPSAPPANPLIAACPINGDTAVAGQFYSHQIIVSGGAAPYTFALTSTSGPLPPGLTLDPATGVISGTPLSTGTFHYEVRITDALGATLVVNCTIDVSSGGVCILVPAPTFTPSLIILDEPLELQGS